MPIPFTVIPAQAGLRRQDAEANIDLVDGPKGKLHDAVCNPVGTVFDWMPVDTGMTKLVCM